MLTKHTSSYFIVAALAVTLGVVFHVSFGCWLTIGFIVGYQLYFGVQSAKLDANLRALDRALVVVNARRMVRAMQQ